MTITPDATDSSRVSITMTRADVDAIADILGGVANRDGFLTLEDDEGNFGLPAEGRIGPCWRFYDAWCDAFRPADSRWDGN